MEVIGQVMSRKLESGRLLADLWVRVKPRVECVRINRQVPGGPLSIQRVKHGSE